MSNTNQIKREALLLRILSEGEMQHLLKEVEEMKNLEAIELLLQQECLLNHELEIGFVLAVKI